MALQYKVVQLASSLGTPTLSLTSGLQGIMDVNTKRLQLLECMTWVKGVCIFAFSSAFCLDWWQLSFEANQMLYCHDSPKNSIHGVRTRTGIQIGGSNLTCYMPGQGQRFIKKNWSSRYQKMNMFRVLTAMATYMYFFQYSVPLKVTFYELSPAK